MFFLSHVYVNSDTLIEEEVDGNSVADIFKLYGESFFRDREVSWKGRFQVFIFFSVSTFS